MVNVWKPGLKFPDSATAILIGPGLASPGLAGKMKAFTQKLWRDADLPMVVDASALDWLPAGKYRKKRFGYIRPHPGEAARLLKTTVQKIQKNRVASLREISRRFGNCWVVLKGNQTLIGRSRGRHFREPVRQSTSRARRQRRCAGGFHCRTDGATGVAGRRWQNDPLRRLAARRGGGCIAVAGNQTGSWRIWLNPLASRNRAFQAEQGKQRTKTRNFFDPIVVRLGVGPEGFQATFAFVVEDGAVQPRVEACGRVNQAGRIRCAHLEHNAHLKFAQSFPTKNRLTLL